MQIKMATAFLTCPIVYSNHCQGQISRLDAAVRSRPAVLRSYTRTDELRSYPDSLVYQFKPQVIPKADNEPVHPLPFRVKLPAGLLRSYASGFDSFGFLYPDKQVIYVYLNGYNQNIRDTSYRILGDEEINRLLVDDLNTVNSSSKLDIDNNPFDSTRGTWLISRGKASILLYNIRQENMTHFLRFAGSFTFL